ncbi:PREDICTED: F-box/FBD/LRR-repeat protein At1g13570-like isoform X2 [Ipomoea nil]|uniref:F-box/FBD/LRR-repeat protein At1g13570-like isoform X2 n=1 Tax=Ipomoea nil TaxID=35883 RepID=UPI000901916C|nr:PREDICTED: F-box/FBD/LRR-repeat protein At1g13570-like isoform X2 [Ipomoea nil]
MASCRRRKSEAGAGMDAISELPAEVKERILECLPTRDAARTALLSTHWNDVWLRHGQLVFDKDFFECFSKYEGEKGMAQISTINDILMLRGPVKKFTLHIRHASDPKPQQSDLDRWCRLLSRNGLQELSLFISDNHQLPSCIFSCRTVKQLFLGDLIFDLSIPGCIFPSATSLAFKHAEFSDNVKGIVYRIPNLEELSFSRCKGITNFEIISPKLESLRVIGSLCWELDDSRWFTLYLRTIKALCLSANLLPCKNAGIATTTFPTAINLRVIELYELSFSCGEKLAFVLQLLQHSPNLCELKMTASDNCMCEITTGTRLLDDPNSCILKQDLKILNTVMIEGFSGSIPEKLFVKVLLLKSPALERFLIMEYADIDTSEAVKSLRELLHFPRASLKARIVCVEHDDTVSGLFNYIWF